MKKLISEKRGYCITTAAQARSIAHDWLNNIGFHKVETGLPEIDDRHDIWRVSLLPKLGEIVIDAYTSKIISEKTTDPKLIQARLLLHEKAEKHCCSKKTYPISNLPNIIGKGNCVDLIQQIPEESVDLIFTSPPYLNARPEYSEYENYDNYLSEMRKIIKCCHRVLSEGRFFVMNSSPILLRRPNRNSSSKRIAVPFDLHRIFIEEGFDFIDDIIWVKPEGAGWATGRGRRFAADRNPLQYKAVPITEYVMVYRKHSERLIDWNIRNYPDSNLLSESKIPDGYEKTNIWKITPSTKSGHPAAFPVGLAERVITYYSFKNDVVLDPFAGSGTVGEAAVKLSRRFVLFEINPEYIKIIQNKNWIKSVKDLKIIK